MDIKNYIVHRIPKSDGTLRVIHEPVPELKLRQEGVLHWLLARGISAWKYAHGFVRGRSTATNAAVHIGRKVILKADLKDFFGTTKSPVIKRILMGEGISKVNIPRTLRKNTRAAVHNTKMAIVNGGEFNEKVMLSST